jgi:uncharacterized membrane protein YhhN
LLLIPKNILYFALLFFTVLTVDIYVKLYLDVIPYRYISKPLVMLSIALFYLSYKKRVNKKNKHFFIGFLCFLLGDIFLINDANQISFLLGMLFFITGKLLYVYRFLNSKDFNIVRLIPLLLFSFIYVVGLLLFIYMNLGDLIIPVLIYYYISQILLLMSFLRLDTVDRGSFILVFIGVVAFIISETIVALSIFHIKMGYQDSAIMVTYGISQFLILIGVLIEKPIEKKM